MTALVLTVALAAALWGVMFGLKLGNFWLYMTFSASILALLALVAQRGSRARLFAWRSSHAVVGVAGAVILYAVFLAGARIAAAVLPFAPAEVGGIYELSTQASPAVTGLLLALVIGPAEEIYWRGYLQDRLARRFGGLDGWIVAGVAYGGVHLWPMNFMLVLAAFVAGLFWGLLYWRRRSLWPGIISHALWDLTIFVLLPVR